VKYRLPDSIHGKQTWRQHFVSESSDSENSDDDLNATEPGDAGGSPGKSSLFFLTGFHPEIRLSGDRV